MCLVKLAPSRVGGNITTTQLAFQNSSSFSFSEINQLKLAFSLTHRQTQINIHHIGIKSLMSTMETVFSWVFQNWSWKDMKALGSYSLPTRWFTLGQLDLLPPYLHSSVVLCYPQRTSSASSWCQLRAKIRANWHHLSVWLGQMFTPHAISCAEIKRRKILYNRYFYSVGMIVEIRGEAVWSWQNLPPPTLLLFEINGEELRI